MKLIKNIFLTTVMVATIVLATSCNTTNFEPIPIDGLLGEEEIEATHTIKQLIDEYGVGNVLFGVNKIDSEVVIKGIVISSDTEGSIYKNIVIQEEKPNSMSIKISLDVNSTAALYPLGQRVAVKCHGLVIGNYAQSPQLGTYYENKDKERIEPGRMAKYIADQAIVPYGMPEPNAIVPDTLTITQIRNGGSELFNRLVYIKDAFFTGMGADYGKPASLKKDELIFAPSTNGVGYPQSREIQDGTGSIFISTSEYARFASYPLPYSDMKGDITAIVGWYNDKDKTLSSRKIYHQLTLRTIKDLGKGFESYHAANQTKK